MWVKQETKYLTVRKLLSKKLSPAEDCSEEDMFNALQHLPEELSGVQELLS